MSPDMMNTMHGSGMLTGYHWLFWGGLVVVLGALAGAVFWFIGRRR